MSNEQDITPKAQPGVGESVKDGVQSNISSTPDKGALGDKSLDDVSGGLWPYVTTGNTYNKGI